MKLAVSLASVVLLSVLGCSDSDPSGAGGGGGGGDGGSTSSPSGTGGGSGTGGAASTSSTGGTGTTGTGTATGTGTGTTTGTGTSSTSSGDTSSVTATVSSGTTGGGTDDYAAERTACINRINELRATKGAFAYQQWGEAELCTDGQATSDESTGSPHGSFGSCGESSQNECLGHGPQGIVQCLDQMWAEKDLPGCAGCDACALGDQAGCDNCDFFGQETGDVCGHYVNMRSLAYSRAACGFSSLGGWNVINFQ